MKKKSCKYGVPQGSNLGPVLFNIYINKIFKLAKYVKIFGYADDILLISSHKDLAVALHRLQLDFNMISKWMHDSELIINAQKSMVMNIHLRNKKILIEPIIKYHKCTCKWYGENDISSRPTRNIACDCEQIKIVEDCNYLGIQIDKGLIWNKHIEKIQN